MVADATYCDRYWECLTGERELYDCPNGLVWVGKNRGIADGCDYPWRNPTICSGKDLASEYNIKTAWQVALKLSWFYLPFFTMAKYTYSITTYEGTFAFSISWHANCQIKKNKVGNL